jgi:hypothetical protein
MWLDIVGGCLDVVGHSLIWLDVVGHCWRLFDVVGGCWRLIIIVDYDFEKDKVCY